MVTWTEFELQGERERPSYDESVKMLDAFLAKEPVLDLATSCFDEPYAGTWDEPALARAD